MIKPVYAGGAVVVNRDPEPAGLIFVDLRNLIAAQAVRVFRIMHVALEFPLLRIIPAQSQPGADPQDAGTILM